jgi:molybdopterin converting factor small subunit
VAIVHIPTQMRSLARGRDRVEARGSTLRQVIETLDADYPGMKDQLIEDGKIRSQLAIAVDGTVVESGLVAPVAEDAEIYVIPAIGGGLGRTGGP